MKLSDLLKPGAIKVGLESEDKEEVFEEMLHVLMREGMITDRAAALKALLEREAKMSTGVGDGLGIPHGKIEEAKGLIVALGTSREGIEFDALDDEPVHVLIVVFAEIGNPGPHIEALAEISRVFMIPGVTDEIRRAADAGEVLDIIRKQE